MADAERDVPRLHPGAEEPGDCVCLRCGFREHHRAGIACRTERCPECGAATVREGSTRHQAYLKGRHHEGG